MVVRSKRSRKRSVTKSRRRTSKRRNSRNRKRVSKKKSRRSSKKKRRSRKRSSKKKRRSRRRYSNKNRKQKLKGGAAVGASNILQKLFSHIKKYDDINTDVQDEVRDAFAAKGKMEIIKKVMKKRMKRMKRLDFNDKVVEEKIIKDVTQFLVALVKLVISQNKTHIGGSELDGTVPQILPDESLVEVEEEGDWRDPNKTGMVSSEKQEMNLLSKYVRAVDFAVLGTTLYHLWTLIIGLKTAKEIFLNPLFTVERDSALLVTDDDVYDETKALVVFSSNGLANIIPKNIDLGSVGTFDMTLLDFLNSKKRQEAFELAQRKLYTALHEQTTAFVKEQMPKIGDIQNLIREAAGNPVPDLSDFAPENAKYMRNLMLVHKLMDPTGTVIDAADRTLMATRHALQRATLDLEQRAASNFLALSHEVDTMVFDFTRHLGLIGKMMQTSTVYLIGMLIWWVPRLMRTIFRSGTAMPPKKIKALLQDRM